MNFKLAYLTHIKEVKRELFVIGSKFDQEVAYSEEFQELWK
jgi:hypothetical protein